MTKRFCSLCLKEGTLKESHILPKFLFKWLKDTSGTGFLRFGKSPNLRSQDGLKIYLLCGTCEGLFSKWEKEFANILFFPLTSRKNSRFRYHEWLLKFSVSLSWRVLLYLKKETPEPKNLTEELRQEINNAQNKWSEFLLDQQQNVDRYEQHILLLGPIESYSDKNMPPNINRYLLRSIDMDVGFSKNQAFVYVKLPLIIFIGFIKIDDSLKWEGTKIQVKQGLIEYSQCRIPDYLGEYIKSKAKRIGELQTTISENQQTRIKESLLKNGGELTESGTFMATEADVRLFGMKAFSKEAGFNDLKKEK